MKLDRVTITGLDDKVDYQTIKDLTAQFPFVEWGVLMSKTRKGSPRYPSLNWIAGLIDFFTGPDGERTYQQHFAAHLCGELCNIAINDRGALLQQQDYLGGPPLCWLFGRVQLNSYPDQLYTAYRINAMYEQTTRDLHIVLPVSNEKVENHAMTMRGGLHFLYDGSRGRGLSPDGWPLPKIKGYTGFAGGITPDNVRDLLTMWSESQPTSSCYWIDLESGARTDDQFDVNKAVSVLTIAQEFIVA